MRTNADFGPQRKSGNGLGFGTILFLIFLVLKLTGYIAWSWWWVAAPLWIPFAVVLVCVLIVAVVKS